MKLIYCCRLKSQYFGAPKSGAPKMRGIPAVAGIAGGCSYATGRPIWHSIANCSPPLHHHRKQLWLCCLRAIC